MIKDETLEHINLAFDIERLNAIQNYGESYHTVHEGYAVLKEEVEEVQDELKAILMFLDIMWEGVKADDNNKVCQTAKYIIKHCQQLAAETAQVAAVSEKINISGRG